MRKYEKQAFFFFTAALLLVCGVAGAQSIGFTSSALDGVTYGAGITRKPNYSAFRNFSTDLQFLINMGSFSTGLRLKLQFIDNKTVDNTHNVVITNPDGTVVNYLENDFTSNAGFVIPFYTQTGNLKHYGEFVMNFSNVDKSRDTIISGTRVKLSVVSGTVIPAAYYKLSMPLGPNNNQVSFFGLVAVPVTYTNTASKITTVSTAETVNNQWSTKVDFALGVYIPLPDDYRLDVTFSPSTNITQFGQLIVPIN